MMTLLALFAVLAEAESAHERLLAQPRQLTNLQLNVNCPFGKQYPDDCFTDEYPNGCANDTAAKTELDEFLACATPVIDALNNADFNAWKMNKNVGEEYCNAMKPAVECAPAAADALRRVARVPGPRTAPQPVDARPRDGAAHWRGAAAAALAAERRARYPAPAAGARLRRPFRAVPRP